MGQMQMGESGQRKMKSRDPRRVFLESHIERGDSSSSGDTVKVDGMVPLDPRKAEGSLAVKATAEAPGRNDKETIQASKQGANIAPPQFVAGLSASSSPQVVICEPLVNSDGGHMVSGPVTDGSAGDVPTDAEVISVPSESVSQELPEQQQKDKSTAANVGPRKPKGSPSQWGASQVHPHLEQLLGDLSEEDRRSVQLERQRRMEEQDRMFSAGKLCLVLDLDHTLLNSAKVLILLVLQVSLVCFQLNRTLWSGLEGFGNITTFWVSKFSTHLLCILMWFSSQRSSRSGISGSGWQRVRKETGLLETVWKEGSCTDFPT